MTALFPDPREEFLAQDPTALVEPELAQEEVVTAGHGVVKPALGLAAAYLVYRTYMARRVKEEVIKAGGEITHPKLMMIASAVWNAFIPRWVSMTAPYLVAGYVEGVRVAQSGHVPEPYLRVIARGYAEELGNHINEVSAEALVSGFNAQVNRKIPPFLAAKRVSDAYGVPRRGMNALVNVWTAEEQARLSDLPLPSIKAQRAEVIIRTQNVLRARQIGDNEEWAARTQAKQIVWMYGQENGVIPADARRVWITANDERVCEICGPMDGVSAPVGKKFTTTAGQYWTPPTHINCRCDVALDLVNTEDIQHEITALLANETVHKSRPGDPYDRDKVGRFARTESRPARVKEREAEVDALLAQVNQALKEPAQVHAPELKRIKQPVQLQTLKVLKLPSEPKIKLKSQIENKIHLKLKVPLSPALFQTPITPHEVETPEGTWEPLEFPLVHILPNWGENPVDYDQKVIVLLDEDDEWHEVHPGDSMPDKYERSLQKAIGDHWDAWIRDMQEEFYNKSNEERTYHDPDRGLRFRIDDEAYTTVLIEAANDIPMDQSEKIRLYGYGEFADEYIEVSAYELASYMGIFEEAADAAPHLLVVKHGMPGVTVRKSGRGVWSNPGKWRLIGSATSERYLTHYPYQIHYAEPSELLGE